MQVSAMIVWTIFRDEDGPMRAYRMLGEDLSSDVPTTANNLMSSFVASIVRNKIANSELVTIVKERKELRKTIMAELRPILKGWGIYAETVEITDVKIMSGNLFKDLQFEYRDQQYSKATKQKLEVDHEIN